MPTPRLVAASLVAAAAGCTSSYTVDHAAKVAIHGDQIVVVGRATTHEASGGLGCGGPGEGADAAVHFVSHDGGVTYERLDTDVFLRDVWSFQGGFIAVGFAEGAYTSSVYVSDDGVTWTPSDLTVESPELHAVVRTDDVHVTLERGIASSVDGRTWSRPAMADDPFAGETFDAGWYMPLVGAAQGKIVAAQPHAVAVSRDGVQWTASGLAPGRAILDLTTIGDHVLAWIASDDGSEPSVGITWLDLDDPAASPAPIAIADVEIGGVVAIPAGALFTDGSLLGDLRDLAARQPHVAPFDAASTDDTRVAVLRTGAVAVSDDGGLTFRPAVELPLE